MGPENGTAVPASRLFARRFTTAGEVTAVPPKVSSTVALANARFSRGVGVRAAVTLPPGGSARLGLFDVAGRRVADMEVAGSGAAIDVTLPGTEDLAAGIYFLRLAGTSTHSNARVLVTP